jgi:hypothetical protein
LPASGCSSLDGLDIRSLAKTNIDEVSEIHMQQVAFILRTLTDKLYKKNPSELRKSRYQTIESSLNRIFTCPPEQSPAELDHKSGTEAILLGFDPGYTGDRVFAVMYGLYTMIHASYNSKCELFIPDTLNEQALYNSARNIEIFVWRLNTRLKEDGHPLIFTNTLEGEVKNLSYERLFGKLISLQDTMALIVSNRTGRIIKEAVLFAGMAFLPIGL